MEAREYKQWFLKETVNYVQPVLVLLIRKASRGLTSVNPEALPQTPASSC